MKAMVIMAVMAMALACFASRGVAAEAEAGGMTFGKGIPNPYGKYFVGDSYLKILVKDGVGIANVTFAPCCRNNWHIHHAAKGGGQILLVTDGRGWYQEWGRPAQALKAGDVVQIPAGVKHWHGAAKDSEFVHISVEVPGESSSTEWLEPVDEKEYFKL